MPYPISAFHNQYPSACTPGFVLLPRLSCRVTGPLGCSSSSTQLLRESLSSSQWAAEHSLGWWIRRPCRSDLCKARELNFRWKNQCIKRTWIRYRAKLKLGSPQISCTDILRYLSVALLFRNTQSVGYLCTVLILSLYGPILCFYDVYTRANCVQVVVSRCAICYSVELFLLFYLRWRHAIWTWRRWDWRMLCNACDHSCTHRAYFVLFLSFFLALLLLLFLTVADASKNKKRKRKGISYSAWRNWRLTKLIFWLAVKCALGFPPAYFVILIHFF